jgi:superfamily I DNA and/or RNA helicase
MNELIMNWSSKAVYENNLRAADSVKNHSLNEGNCNEIPVMVFIDTAFCNLGESINLEDHNQKSKFNEGESDLVSIVYQELKSYGIKDENIGKF